MLKFFFEIIMATLIGICGAAICSFIGNPGRQALAARQMEEQWPGLDL